MGVDIYRDWLVGRETERGGEGERQTDNEMRSAMEANRQNTLIICNQ